MRELKQSTAANVMVFMTDSADHIAGKTGLTLTITASKDGAAFASITPTVTERGSGWYNLALTTSHVDTLGDLALHVTGTGADPSDLPCRIVAGALDADVSSRLSTAGYAAPNNGGITTIIAYVDELESRLTNGRAANLDNLDATISSRSTYAGGDTSGVTTLLARLTAIRAGLLDNLDATISSRSTYAGGDTSGVTTLLARLTSGRATNLDFLDVAVSAISAYVVAVKAKTDQMNFTVAGQVDVNVQSINDEALVGDGSGTPWGPT